MHESLLRRSSYPGACRTRWRDVARPSGANLPRQWLINRPLASPTHCPWPSAPQALDWPAPPHCEERRNAPARSTHRLARCHLTRTHPYLGARARYLALSLDDESRDCSAALLTKKKSLSASERDPWARAAFQVQIAEQNAYELVIVDEFGCNLDLTRRYARAPIGERACGSVPRNTPTNQTIIA